MTVQGRSDPSEYCTSAGRALLGRRGMRSGDGTAGSKLGGCRQREQWQLSGQGFYWWMLHRPRGMGLTLFSICIGLREEVILVQSKMTRSPVKADGRWNRLWEILFLKSCAPR